MNIPNIVEKFKKDHRYFHSETDFQFALAWYIHKEHENATVLLEYPYGKDKNSRSYLDMYIKDQNIKYGIELKYKTTFAHIKAEPEDIHLTNQAAHGNACYDYWKDVERLEKMIEGEIIHKGYAIFLTNASVYSKKEGEPWHGRDGKIPDYSEFRIRNARTIKNGNKKSKILNWRDGVVPKGATKDRADVIEIRNQYTIKWNNFSTYKDKGVEKNKEFQYLCLEIPPKK